jgi:hypothetical protein
MNSYEIVLKIDGDSTTVYIEADNEETAIKQSMDDACLGGVTYPDYVELISCELL